MTASGPWRSAGGVAGAGRTRRRLFGLTSFERDLLGLLRRGANSSPALAAACGDRPRRSGRARCASFALRGGPPRRGRTGARCRRGGAAAPLAAARPRRPPHAGHRAAGRSTNASWHYLLEVHHLRPAPGLRGRRLRRRAPGSLASQGDYRRPGSRAGASSSSAEVGQWAAAGARSGAAAGRPRGRRRGGDLRARGLAACRQIRAAALPSGAARARRGCAAAGSARRRCRARTDAGCEEFPELEAPAKRRAGALRDTMRGPCSSGSRAASKPVERRRGVLSTARRPSARRPGRTVARRSRDARPSSNGRLRRLGSAIRAWPPGAIQARSRSRRR